MRGLALLASVGHLKLIGNASAFGPQANTSIWISRNPVSSKSCRPTRHTRGAAHCVPDGPKQANCLTAAVHEVGPCEGLFGGRFWLLWANTSSLETSVHSHHRPMRSFRSAEIPLTENYTGPRDILMVQPIFLLMGQSESIV